MYITEICIKVQENVSHLIFLNIYEYVDNWAPNKKHIF